MKTKSPEQRRPAPVPDKIPMPQLRGGHAPSANIRLVSPDKVKVPSAAKALAPKTEPPKTDK